MGDGRAEGTGSSAIGDGEQTTSSLNPELGIQTLYYCTLYSTVQ